MAGAFSDGVDIDRSTKVNSRKDFENVRHEAMACNYP